MTGDGTTSLNPRPDAPRLDSLARRIANLPEHDLADLPPGVIDLSIETLSQAGITHLAVNLFDAANAQGLPLALPDAAAQALEAAGNPRRASRLLQDWTPPRPLPPYRVAQAQALMRLRDWPAAMTVLQAATEQFPDNALLHRLAGQAALWGGHGKTALDALTRAVALDPAQPAWVRRALSGLQRRDMQVGGLVFDLPAQVVSAVTIAGLASGSYERQERDAALADLRDGDRVLELGAGIGAMAMWISRANANIPVTSVEGNPDLAPLIRHNFAQNNCTATLIEGLAALHDGEMEFYPAPDFWASSTRPTTGADQPTRLPCIDTRRLMADIQPTILIVDIEGAEAEVLPALDLSTVRRIIVEMHPKLIDAAAVSGVFRALLSAGFDIDLAQDRGDVYVFNRATGAAA